MVAAAAYRLDGGLDPMHYANRISREFAAGENGDRSGWNECHEAERNQGEIGIACEGTRSIALHGDQLVHVNYQCEFQFKPFMKDSYRVGFAVCQ